MPTIGDLCDYLRLIAPLDLAEDWDNVGLLVGSAAADVQRVMTCLTVTPSTVDEAIQQEADVVVTHHPFPFRALNRITTSTPVGRMLLQLIENRIAVYSAHTAFDSASGGINRQLADSLALCNTRPLCEPRDSDPAVGTGRVGDLREPMKLADVAKSLKSFLGIDYVRTVGAGDTCVRRIGVACGSAGQFIEQARGDGCQLLVTGETSFHTCLEAEATDISLLLLGHFASERFAMESLAVQIGAEYPDLNVWPSQTESDPLRLL